MAKVPEKGPVGFPSQIAAYCLNAWQWDYGEFCRRTGMPEDDYSRDEFLTFQRTADALRQCDPHLLAVLTRRPD